MTHPHPTHADRVDELFALLADRHCRAVLSYFRNAQEDRMPTWDLANEIRDESRGQTQAVTQLRHSTIPRLADAGVVDHNPSSELVHYRGHTELEALLDALEEQY